MTTTQWRAPARLSVSGPDGWAPVERLEVHHLDGDALVSVESWPVGAATDLDGLARQHLDRRIGDRAPSALVEGDVLGRRDGRRSTTTWSDDAGQTIEARLGYVLRGRRMFAVTEVGPRDDDLKRADMASILSSLVVAGPAVVEEESLPMRSEPCGDLAEVRDAWLRGVVPDQEPAHILTLDEALGAARHFQVTMLPGADGSAWTQLDNAQRELAAAVAWRSLAARGADEPSPLREALEIAASHDFLIVVTRRRRGESSTEWFAARPDRMTRVAHGTSSGTLRLTSHDTGALADIVLASETDQDSEVTVSCVYRSAGRVVGHEMTWQTDTAEAARSALAGLLPADPAT